MAANSNVNASVEQANVSSGWDEARSDASTSPVTLLEMKKKSVDFPAPESSGRDLHANFHDMKRRVRSYLARGKNECQRAAKIIGREARWLKYEHPGYVVGAAAVAGFACGLLLRTRQSKRRLNLYE